VNQYKNQFHLKMGLFQITNEITARIPLNEMESSYFTSGFGSVAFITKKKDAHKTTAVVISVNIFTSCSWPFLWQERYKKRWKQLANNLDAKEHSHTV
jgi:hypothetical protein